MSGHPVGNNNTSHKHCLQPSW